MKVLGLVKDEKDHLEKLLELSPEAAVVQAYNQVEKLVLEIIQPKNRISKDIQLLCFGDCQNLVN